MRISDWSSDVCSSDLPEFFKDAACVLVNGYGWLHLFPLQETGTFVGGNPVDPGEKLRVSPEIGEMIPYPDEDLLHQIIGVFVRNNKTANMPINPLLISQHEFIEGSVPGCWVSEALQ